MITEDRLEQLSLDWFRESGWEYANGVDISPGDDPERDDYRVVVLKDRLAEAVARLNPDLPQSAVDDVVHVVANPDHPSLEQNNRALHRLYTNGVKVEYSTDGGKETIYAQIIDFQNPDNNDLLVVNQFSVAGTKPKHWRWVGVPNSPIDSTIDSPISCNFERRGRMVGGCRVQIT